MKQLELFNFTVSVCKECEFYKPTPCNYGWCTRKKIGSIDRAVYENSPYCEMDRRLFNNKLLSNRLSGKITHYEMYEHWKKET